jgi:CubicO group peptidase (beta-lactamase class C family)
MSRFLTPLLAVACLVAPAQSPAPSFAVQADRLLTDRYAEDLPGAAVLVAQDGKTIFRKGYGLASVELKVPVTPDMVFRIGSMTKQFTATGILLLAEEGKVDLKAPISHYLDKTPASWAKVTVEMLLNHTSGIPSYTSDPTFDNHFREDFTPAQLLETFVNAKPLDFEPGTSQRYDNTGYFLLGLIIEKATGQTWDAFLKTRIFAPLGMVHTRLGKETGLIPGLVSGYTTGPLPAPYLSMTQPGAAGALVSSVDDLAIWTQALHGGKVLKPESLARMLAPTKLPNNQTIPYGFGLATETMNGRTLVGHGGGINGFVCFMLADPQKHTLAVILNNTDRPKGSDSIFARKLLALAAGDPAETAPVAAPLDRTAFDVCAGEYELAPGFVLKIWREGDTLYAQATNQPRIEIFPEGPYGYFLKVVEAKLHFEKGNDGKVDRLVLFQGGRELPGRRTK